MELNRKIRTIAFLVCVAMSSCGPISGSPIVSSPVPEDSTTTISPLPSLQHTLTLTFAPTITLMPALPAVEAEAKVLEMLHDNKGCRLPCFWGFIPGETGEETTISVLHEFQEISPNGELIIKRDNLLMNISIGWGNDDPPRSDIVRWIKVYLSAYQLLENENKYVYDSPYYSKYFQYYTLPYLLSTYGPPENAYVFFENDMGTYEYYLLLDYTKSGWVAMFTMPLTRSGEFFVGCPAQSFTALWLWSPEDAKTAGEYGFANGPGALLPIEKATSMTLQEFYQRYKNPTDTECLETPADIYTR